MRFVGQTPVLKGKKINHFFNDPLKINSDNMILLYKKCDEKLVAFSVKKHTVNCNVERNHLKRIMRESYRKTENLFATHYSYFFIAKTRCISLKTTITEMQSMAGRIHENN